MDPHSLDSENWTRQCLLSTDPGAYLTEMALWVFLSALVIGGFTARKRPIPLSDVKDALGSDNVYVAWDL